MNYLKIITTTIFLLFFNTTSFSKIEVNVPYVILQDHLSGEILYDKDSDTKIYPASMTKIMTTIVVFELIKKGDLSLDEEITISEKAWRMSKSGYSSMFIMLNDKVTVEDLLKGIIIVSGNDACVALAEGVSGTEENFVMLMNEKAAEIGMDDTNFNNSSGINDSSNYSTVRDLLKMSRYLIKNYPEFYSYYKEKTFTWERTGGDPITQGNRNPLLYKNIGADGIKTGFLTVEKYSLASSIKSGQRRINAVGSGFETKNARSNESVKLLTWALRNFDTILVAKKNEPFLKIKLWLGKKDKFEVTVKEDIYLTIPKRKKKIVKVIAEYESPIKAPIKKGDKIGVLNVYVSGELKKREDIFVYSTVKRANILSRIFRSLNYLVWGDV